MQKTIYASFLRCSNGNIFEDCYRYNPAADVERPKKDNFVSGYYNAEQLTEMFEVF